jgi:predicted site-specific integrase-resolvase
MAAQIIGMSYKTLKKRYDEGWIKGERTTHDKLKFAIDEVERAKLAWQQERAELVTSSTNLTMIDPSRNDLEARIIELEEEVATLQAKVARLEVANRIELPQVPPKGTEPLTPHTIPISKDPLPEGCVLASKFAESHGVSRSTFRWQMDHGKVSYSERPKASRPREVEKYLTPEQQENALAYWRTQGN